MASPDRVYTQAMLVSRLGLGKRTVRDAVNRLAALGALDVDARFGMKLVSLDTESALGRALQVFYRSLSDIRQQQTHVNGREQ
jgi:DNA-binding GntR family transcriptional regulator